MKVERKKKPVWQALLDISRRCPPTSTRPVSKSQHCRNATQIEFAVDPRLSIQLRNRECLLPTRTMAGCGRRSSAKTSCEATLNIFDIYSQQYQWRSWPTILDALPSVDKQLVLDLGCGIGDLAVDLSARGATVVGVDFNDEVVAFAKSRFIANAKFHQSDLRTFHDPSICADGIWSSFTAAYFPALRDVLTVWIDHLRPGGWVALTEIDDFFGHHPLSNRTTELLAMYVQDAAEHARYDFQMGRKLPSVAEKVGLKVIRQFTVPDAELSFTGRATPDVRNAWTARLDQMHLLRNLCGVEFDAVRDDFMNCLDRDDHYCSATVQCCIAVKHESTLE
jgi:SAM-dependent methyltransferase